MGFRRGSDRYPRSVPRSLAATLLAGACLLQAAPPAAGAPQRLVTTRPLTVGLRTRSAATATSTTNSETPVPVAPSIVPPAGRRLSPDDVLEIAGRLPKMRRVRAEYPGSYDGAYLKGTGRWQVSYFSRKGKEIGQVIISDASGRVLEQWTGFQVAWTMARGYPGAFGRHVNALYVWLPLCALFLLPFIEWRRPFALRHLDLLMLLSFSVSLGFFNHGEIYKSVPLTYPPLIYLLVRMLLLLRSGARPRPLKLLIPAPWLAVGVVFLLGFRIGLNVTDGNVIDVGYAGVIGAQRIADGKPLYGGYPSDNEHGDTYGPVNYETYVPFEQIFGWSGLWDDLPAAHAAAIAFDLLAVGLIFLLGLRIRGPTLGVALAYAWVSYPFTLFVLESDSNDALVAVLLLAVLLVVSSPPARGVFAALAGLTKLAPLALAPLLAMHGLRDIQARPGGQSNRRGQALALFVLAFALTAAVVSIPALTHDSLHEIYERTIVYQSNRGAPFSVWGLYGGMKSWQTLVQAVAVALALGLAVLPRRRGIPALAAACAAVLIALQLGLEYWFYLYIVWFFPLVMVALLAAPGRAISADPDPDLLDLAVGRPEERSPGATTTPSPQGVASEPARSSPLATAWSSGSPRRSATGPPRRSESAPASA
jgi:Glycosyltransferase family 87